MNAKPVFNRIIIKRDKDALPMMYDGNEIEFREGRAYKKNSSFQIPVAREIVEAHNRELQGEVMAIGPVVEQRMGENCVKVGDIVRYSKYAIIHANIDDEAYDLINDEDLHFVLGNKGE